MTPDPTSRVSVIVPALNEERAIARTLESLLAQTRPPDEIIVADGGSTDRTREIAAGFSSRAPGVRVVDNPRRRVGAARNVGVEAARHPCVALIDSGNHADPRWLECILAPLAAGAAAVSYGRILPLTRSAFEAGVAHVLFDYLFTPFAGGADERRRAREGKEMISSSCMAYRRDVLERVGGYPEWLDTAEDKLFVQRLRHLGIPIVHAPDAVVHHHMRGDAAALARMYFRYGRGTALSGQTSRNTARLAVRYAVAAGGAAAALGWTHSTARVAAIVALAAGGLLYLARQGYRPLWRSGGPRSAHVLSLVPIILLARDAGSLAGHLAGFARRIADRGARARAREYVMHGSRRSIVRAYRAEDREQIMAMYGRVWGAATRSFMERVWDWKYEACPGPRAGGRRLVAETNGRVVGFRGYQPMEFKLGAERRAGAWLADYMVDPDQRGRGAGIALARTTILDDFVFGQVGDQFVRYWSKLAGFDARVARLTWVRRELRGTRALVDAVRSGCRGRGWRRPRWDGVRVEAVPSPDVLADALPALLESHDAIACRSVDYLRWRFFECPYGTHRMFVARRGEDVAGYVVLREDRPNATLVADVLAAREDVPAYGALLETALEEARRAGKRSVEALAPAQPGGFARALALAGFVPPPRAVRRCHLVGKVEPALRPIAHDAGRWHVTPGDSDIDMRDAR